MKSLFTTLLIASYVAIGIFGIFDMHQQADMRGHDMAPGNCIAAAARGMDCPKEAGTIDSAAFHLDAFRGFSLATFGENLLASLLSVLALLVIGVGLGALLGNFAPPRLNLAYSRYGPGQFSPPPKQQLLRWLALHENSPAFP
ncbi:hypothetical protein HY418_00900 [Candidatus Kaiserbacteria bacterium]|nr:hypothetical protein [Candidatus Kaiserbacteria bacterium]